MENLFGLSSSVELMKRIFHLAEADNWPAIQRTGLKCASDLIAESGLTGESRIALERAQRPKYTALRTGVFLRDQKPMTAAELRDCLVDMSPADWYALLNARVFFWIDAERLNRQRKACEPRAQVVLTIDAPRLIAHHAERVTLTPINSGNARRKPARRGAATFVPYQEWVRSRWTSESRQFGETDRSRTHRPVELTVRGSLPYALEFVLDVRALRPGELFAAA